jgi:hypothetical protein
MRRRRGRRDGGLDDPNRAQTAAAVQRPQQLLAVPPFASAPAASP